MVIMFPRFFFFRQWHLLKGLSVQSVASYLMIKTFALVCSVVVTAFAQAAWSGYSLWP